MTLVLTANVAGQACGPAVSLPNRRRRLSTVVARHRPQDGRRFIVSVHRRGEACQPCDRSVRLRADWKRTLVGPQDTVLITVVPLGSKAASIGAAIASIALIALAPYAAPVLAGAMLGLPGAAAGTLATAIQVGMVVGGVALAYAAQRSKAAKDRTADVYSVSGGGNLPKPGTRRPLLYGKCWSSPPLSQKDYFGYDGDTMVLVKRMTLGIGKFQIHQVKVGDAVFWTEDGGLQPPFNNTLGPFSFAIEFLYDQPSTIAFADVATSNDVGGQELPRPGGNPDWTPWFRAQPQGVVTDYAAMSWQYPAVMRTSSAGRPEKGAAGVLFMARRIDPATGTVIGPEFELLRADEGLIYSPNPYRRTDVRRWPERGAYEVRARNLYAEAQGFEQKNAATWDELRAYTEDARIRPETTEIAMRVRAGKGLTVTAYSDVTVQATRILQVWNGSAWVEQPTRKAVWAFCDLVRATHGLALPNGVDRDKAKYYADLLTENDTYDGALPEVSSFWEAASQVLHPMRADPVKVGAVHTFVRDESRAEPRHVLTRRQIVRDSSGATYKTKVEGSDVIVEYDRDGDPKRPDEVRYSYGPQTRTPKRFKVEGIADPAHAMKHATWLAAVAVFRGAERRITTEWDGRLVYPGDHILSDLWFLRGKRVFGVASIADNVLQLDAEANVSTEWGYGSIRTRAGREWGILRMRGQGARGLEVHAGDAATLAGQTGVSLAGILARDTQDPTTVVLGELVELQETYVARSSVPADADHVQIEMVADDSRVWQLLDEDVILPAPVGGDSLADPLVPQISVLHARCERIETGIEVIWGVSPTRGARNYEADLSYDSGATWEVLAPFGPASSGRAQERQSDGPVTVRARAFGRTGLPGEWVTATFTTVAPVVDGSLIDVNGLPLLTYANLDDAIKEQLDRVDSIVAETEAALEGAQGRLDEVRKALAFDPAVRQHIIDPIIGDLRGDIDLLTASSARNLADLTALQDALRTAGLETIPSEGRVRFYAIDALRTETQTTIANFAVTVDALARTIELYGSVQTSDLSGLITEITTVQTQLNALAGTISNTVSTATFNALAARTSTAETRLDAQAAEITNRATVAEVTAQGTKLTTVEQGLSAVQGRIFQAVTASSAQAVDWEQLPQTLADLLDYIQRQAGALQEQLARASNSLAASTDATGRATAELRSELLAFSFEASATFVSLTKAIADQTQALLSTQTAYVARFGAAEASIITETLVRATADTAQATKTEGLTSRIGMAEGSITTLSDTVATNQSASATQFSSITARLGTNEATVSSLSTTVTTNNTALGSRIDTVVARVSTAESTIANEASTRATADTALTNQYNAVIARVGNVESGLSTEVTARSDGQVANAQRIENLFARTGIATAYGRISWTAVGAPGGVSARYALQLSTEEYGAQRNTGFYVEMLPSGTSRFIIDANLFAITANGGISYPFTFDGTTLRVPNLELTGGNVPVGIANIPLRFDVGEYMLISGGGTLNSQTDPNVKATFVNDRGDFPTMVTVYGTIELGPYTSITGMQILIDGNPAANIFVGGTGTGLATQVQGGSGPISGNGLRYAGSGGHTVQLRYSYRGDSAQSYVKLLDFHIAGFTPRA